MILNSLICKLIMDSLSLGFSFILGFTFISLQIKEFRIMGLSINDSVYSCLFFFLTGLHFFHLLLGLLLLSLLFWSCSFSINIWFSLLSVFLFISDFSFNFSVFSLQCYSVFSFVRIFLSQDLVFYLQRISSFSFYFFSQEFFKLYDFLFHLLYNVHNILHFIARMFMYLSDASLKISVCVRL